RSRNAPLGARRDFAYPGGTRTTVELRRHPRVRPSLPSCPPFRPSRASRTWQPHPGEKAGSSHSPFERPGLEGSAGALLPLALDEGAGVLHGGRPRPWLPLGLRPPSAPGPGADGGQEQRHGGEEERDKLPQPAHRLSLTFATIRIVG